MKALEDLLVVDLSRILAGPYCTMTLGDMGARIIKIEEPTKGDDTRGWGPPFWNGESAYFLSVNRNKESLTLNLKSEKARAILWQLVERADILVENFRPGTLKKWGFGWDAVYKRNKRLIYASISGYGQTGPDSSRAGYDLIAQAEGGVMSLTGEPDGQPMKAGVSQADIVAGMWATIGILTALHAREKTGRGQLVDASLLEGQLGLLTYQAYNFWAGQTPERLGNRHPNLTPYEAFATRDGHITVGVGSDSLWQQFCRVLESPELITDPRFATNADRVRHRQELGKVLSPIFARRGVEEWLRILKEAGIPSGKVHSVPDILSHPHLEARRMIRDLPHPAIPEFRVISTPLHLSETPPEPSSAPPLLGAHTEAILGELGLEPDEIDSLREQGVV